MRLLILLLALAQAVTLAASAVLVLDSQGRVIENARIEIVTPAGTTVHSALATEPIPDPRSAAFSTRGAHCVPYQAVSTSSVE